MVGLLFDRGLLPHANPATETDVQSAMPTNAVAEVADVMNQAMDDQLASR